MDLSGNIQDLITVATEMRQAPGTDKKALNKTISFLENARLWAKEIDPGKVNGVPNASQAITGDANAQCICPPGARDQSCPAAVHST